MIQLYYYKGRVIFMNLSVLLWNAIIKINPKIKYNGNSELILKNKYSTLIKKGYIDDFLFFVIIVIYQLKIMFQL